MAPSVNDPSEASWPSAAESSCGAAAAMAGAISSARLQRGGEIARQWSSVLDGVERAYGVPRQAILGVWGMETNFGTFTGSMYVVRALATLAHLGYRGDFFRGELLAALEIMER